MLANPKRTKDEIVQWIRSYFESNGPGCDAVVGISVVKIPALSPLFA